MTIAAIAPLDGSTAFERRAFRVTIYPRAMTVRPNLYWIVAGVFAALIAAAPARADDAARIKARALTDAAIQLTDSSQAVKMLWQATDIDPNSTEPYIYLGLYYNSREDFAEVIEVYKKLVKYRPNETSAYLNIGEAYMSFNPPRFNDALPYYKKAYELDPHNSFAALRIGQILARNGDREQATRFLKAASANAGSNPTVAAEATRTLHEMAGF
jgi:tetratricopeptide (TPR) repeat protein